MDRLTPELAHLTKWAMDCLACQEYAEWKARVLAQKYPQEMASLPMLLSNAVNLTKHGPPRGLRPSASMAVLQCLRL
jgi:hypothetical protein